MVADEERARFLKSYNRSSFMFPHGLAGHPLFELPSLIRLAERMPDHRETYWSNGSVAVDHTWAEGTLQRKSLVDTIANIERNNSIVILKHTEQDPEYAAVLQGTLARLVDLSGERLRADATIGEVLILISSPGRVTPYHMDGEANFLLQVAGRKDFYVFDPGDRTLVTDMDLERFYAVGNHIAVYHPDRQVEAAAYDLHPGYGVHIPVTAPHWVRNGDNVSVALSVNYELRSGERLLKLHRLNRRLRRYGLNPRPPGASALGDRVKLLAAGAISAVRSWVRTDPPAHSYAVWTPPPG